MLNQSGAFANQTLYKLKDREIILSINVCQKSKCAYSKFIYIYLWFLKKAGKGKGRKKKKKKSSHDVKKSGNELILHR